MLAPSDSLLRLSANGFQAEIASSQGATVAAIAWEAPDGVRRDMLRGPDDGSWPAPPHRFGIWPLVPFANRAFGAVVDDGERRFALTPNDGAGGAIHGFGWQSVWDVVEHAEARLVLSHRRADGPDPYRYLARLTLELRPGHVWLALSVTNEASEALPYGLGLHPWFPATRETVVTLAARGELALGEGYRPGGFKPWRDGGPYAVGAMRPPCGEIAHSIVDWTGPALFEDARLGLQLAVDASATLRHPVLWSPPEADFICFEPQSHGIGAPSEAAARAVTPLAQLEPGETLEGWMTLMPSLLTSAPSSRT
jgi:aldose 1-epimerase